MRIQFFTYTTIILYNNCIGKESRKTTMNKVYEFDAVIIEEVEHHGAYIEIPFDVKETFNKSRVLVHATFDGEQYDGQIVKMKTVNHILGVRKDIRKKINKHPGDVVHVTIQEREKKQSEIKTVNQYITQFDGDIRDRLINVRKLVLSSSPKISEKIAWGMITFVLNKNLVHFAVQKNHIGFHLSASAIERFTNELSTYKYSKSTVQFPHNKPLPYDLIQKMVDFCIEEVLYKNTL